MYSHVARAFTTLLIAHALLVPHRRRGKVLEKEEATVAESGIDEKGFIVVFVTKPVKAAAEPSAAPAATPAAAAPAPAAAVAAAAAATPAVNAAPSAPPAAAEPTGASFGSLLTGSALETAVTSICEMGFAREEVW